MNSYDLTPDGDKWKFQKQGAKRASKVFETKQEAMKESVEFMHKNGGSLKIHKKDGSYQEERTYPRSEDPRKSPG